MKNPNINSKTLDSVFLCLCDILGFKEIFKSGNIEQISNTYESFISEELFNLTKAIENYVAGEPIRTYLHYLMISDSILIYSIDDSYQNFLKMVGATRFLLQYFFHTGLPVRGAITRGKIKILEGGFNGNQNLDCQVILGAPLIDALNLEKEFKWSGCVVDEKVIEYIRSLDDYKGVSLIDQSEIVNYPLSVKDNKKEVYAVNWTNSNAHLITEEVIRKNFKANGKHLICEEVELKIRNTNEFVRYIEKLGTTSLYLK